jgi:hypothetical protein
LVRPRAASARLRFCLATRSVVLFLNSFVFCHRFNSGTWDSPQTITVTGMPEVFVSMLNLLFRGRSTDLCCGYLAFKREAINRFEIESDGFEIETELNVKALKAGLKVTEMPSFEEKWLTGASNLKAFRDGKRIVRKLFKPRFSKYLNN